jgi:alkylation response protein AidB-like acyl-CoA dehydrogenase
MQEILCDHLTSTIAARAAAIERARRVPADLLDALDAAGCLRVLLPASHGGLGADLARAMREFEALARADGSTGWTVMIAATCWCDLIGLPRPSFDALFAGRSRVIMAGVFNPSGAITRDGSGYRVTGRWSFASGCEHADWLFGNCIEANVDGQPRMRMAVFSPDQVQIEDTWSVCGLSGTGSHHFRADGAFVPAQRTLMPDGDAPCLDEPIARVPVPALLSLSIGAVAIGIAQAALDDITALAAHKTPLLADGTLAGNAHFQFELARADTQVCAARALLQQHAASLWAAAAAGSPLALQQRARVRATAVWATRIAADAVTTAYRAGGGSALYAQSPLQRRLRDVHAVTQHFLVRPDTLTTAGAILAGRDLTVPVF